MVDARLPDGSRINVVVPPLSLGGVSVTIRKFGRNVLSMQDLLSAGSLSGEMARFLELAIHTRRNIVVSGGTGTGKTTLLNCLSTLIPASERVITIEDSAELRLQHENLVRLEARPSNAEGRGLVSIRDLVRNALRMRPDRIVIGECRGGEALDMLQAITRGTTAPSRQRMPTRRAICCPGSRSWCSWPEWNSRYWRFASRSPERCM